MSDSVTLEKESLAYYDSGFIVTAILPQMKDGQWGRYLSSYAVEMDSLNPENKKHYTVSLSKTDPLLGSLLWVWNEAAYKGVVFSRSADGRIVASGKVPP